jgi:hypothetical protein
MFDQYIRQERRVCLGYRSGSDTRPLEPLSIFFPISRLRWGSARRRARSGCGTARMFLYFLDCMALAFVPLVLLYRGKL